MARTSRKMKAVAVETFGGKDKGRIEKVLLTPQLSSGVQAQFRSTELHNHTIRHANAGGLKADGAVVPRPEHPNLLGLRRCVEAVPALRLDSDQLLASSPLLIAQRTI